jgi:hypothetical protein
MSTITDTHIYFKALVEDNQIVLHIIGKDEATACEKDWGPEETKWFERLNFQLPESQQEVSVYLFTKSDVTVQWLQIDRSGMTGFIQALVKNKLFGKEHSPKEGFNFLDSLFG